MIWPRKGTKGHKKFLDTDLHGLTLYLRKEIDKEISKTTMGSGPKEIKELAECFERNLEAYKRQEDKRKFDTD
jgi:hypothetical protein